MLVIGITGGIGSGKSSFSKIAADAGFKVISTDDKAKVLMNSHPVLRERLISEYGNSVFTPEGALNRAFLAESVFGARAEEHAIEKLNSIVHPFVIEYMLEETEKHESAGEKCLFIESALIYEADLEDGFDYIICVYAPEDVCIERIKLRSGLSEDEIKRRMNSQISPEDKRSLADFTINNSGTLEDLNKSSQFILNLVPNLPGKREEEKEE
jgi:dephospho-CoA kinase